MIVRLTFTYLYVCFFIFVCIAQQPCYIFYEDFEDSTLQSHWQGNGTGQPAQFYLTNNSPAVGNSSLESNSVFATTLDGIYADFPSSQPTQISFWVKTSDVMSTGQALVCIGDSNIAMNSSSHIIFVNYHNGNLRVIGGQTYTLPATNNAWYFLEFKNMDWSNQYSDLYIDGQLAVSNFGFRHPMSSVSRVVLSTGWINPNSETSSWDDIAIIGGFTTTWTSNIDTICSGDSYTFPDGSSTNNITQTTIDTSYLQTSTGCDSIIYTTLYVATTVDSIYVSGDTLLAIPDISSINFGPSYSWFDCATDSVLSVTSYPAYTPPIGGSYGVVVSNVGCLDTSFCVTFCGVLTWTSNIDTICSGDSYTFPDGSSTNNITQTTIDTSYLQTSTGCDSIIYTTLYVATTVDSIYVSGDTLLAIPDISSINFGPSYSWFDCATDSVLSVTSYPAYTPPIGGLYGVVVSNVGCIDTSNCLAFSAASTFNDLYSGEFSLYPNPAGDFVSIDLTNNYSEVRLEIFDYSGKLVQNENYLNTQSIEVKLKINKGLYLFKVFADNKNQYFRVIKK